MPRENEQLEDSKAKLQVLQQKFINVSEEIARIGKQKPDESQHIDYQVQNLKQDASKFENIAEEILLRLKLAATKSNLQECLAPLDQERQRVKQCLSWVQSVKSLKQIILGLHNYMEEQNWSLAAEYFKQAHQIPSEILNSSLARIMVPSTQIVEPPPQFLENTQAVLHHLFKKKLTQAVQSSDSKNITYYFKLLPLINKHETGLEIYSLYVSKIILKQSIPESFDSTSQQSIAIIPEVFANILNNIIQMLDKNEAFICKHYGRASLANVWKQVAENMDSKLTQLIDDYWASKGIDQTIKKISSQSTSILANGLDEEIEGELESSEESSRQYLDTVMMALQDIDEILRCWVLFCRYETQLTSEEPEGQMLGHLEVSSQVIRRCRTAHLQIETWFLRQGIQKAYKLNDYDFHASPYVITMVDDTMYLIKLVLDRALETFDCELIIQIVSSIKAIFQSDYLPSFRRMMTDAISSFHSVIDKNPHAPFLDAILNANNDSNISQVRRTIPINQERAFSKLLLLTNSAELSKRSLTSIINNKIETITVDPAMPLESYKSKVLEAIRMLGTEHVSLDSLYRIALDTILQAEIRPQIRYIISYSFKDIQFDIQTELECQNMMQSQKLQISFKKLWDMAYQLVKDTLSSDCLDELKRMALSLVAGPLEQRILRLKYTVFGAIFLESEILAVIAYTAPSYFSRERFAKIREILMVMTSTGKSVASIRDEAPLEILEDTEIEFILKSKIL